MTVDETEISNYTLNLSHFELHLGNFMLSKINGSKLDL